MIVELAERLLVTFGDAREQGRVDRRRRASCGCVHKQANGPKNRKESPHVRHNYSIYGQSRQKDLSFYFLISRVLSIGFISLVEVLQ